MDTVHSQNVAPAFLRKYMWITGPLFPLVACFWLWFADNTGYAVLYWAYPVLAYTFIPVTDWLVGVDLNNPPEGAAETLSDRLHSYSAYAYLPSYFFALFYGAALFSKPGLSWFEMLGAAVTVGVPASVSFIAGHELVHKNNAIASFVTKILNAPTFYGHHFAVYHVRGHHRDVATPDDPTSARFGEGFWRYLMRAMAGGVRVAWQLERQRLEKRKLPVISLRNENIQAWLLTLLIAAVLVGMHGAPILVFLVVQASVAILLFEATNYIQHYGLLRAQTDGQRFEPVNHTHTWDSNHLLTTMVIYQLQRHADHHVNLNVPFQRLRYVCSTPQHTLSYGSILWLAYVPPVWFRYANQKVLKLYGDDYNKINLDKRLMHLRGGPVLAKPESVQ